MAFTIVSPFESRMYVNSNLDGHYLLPFNWLVYGLEHGLLEIEDSQFYETLQGSIYLELLDSKTVSLFKTKHGHVRDVWFEFYPGDDKVWPVFTDDRRTSGYSVLTGSHLKQSVHFVNVNDILQMSYSDQKTVNNSIIQLLKGCRIKLVRSIWSTI